MTSIINNNQLEAICQVLADTGDGLTGTEIGRILSQLGFDDTDPTITKRHRLFNALAARVTGVKNDLPVRQFIEVAMDPVRYRGGADRFEFRRDQLNVAISFMGLTLAEDGKLRKSDVATTLTEAEKRANRLRTELQRRGVHGDVLMYCQRRFLENDYFYAVLEAAKSVAAKIRQKSGLTADGSILVDEAFSKGKFAYPLLAFNKLETPTERSEHNGLTNLLKGLFGAFRNPTAHEPEHAWPITEKDALDLLTIASLLHRRLDDATRTR